MVALALFAMLLQVFVPLVHSAFAAPVRHSLEDMRICYAPSDMAKVEAAKPSGSKTKSTIGHVSCPLCQNINLLPGGIAPPDDAPVLFSTSHIVRITKTDDAASVHYEPIPSARPRAPPSNV